MRSSCYQRRKDYFHKNDVDYFATLIYKYFSALFLVASLCLSAHHLVPPSIRPLLPLTRALVTRSSHMTRSSTFSRHQVEKVESSFSCEGRKSCNTAHGFQIMSFFHFKRFLLFDSSLNSSSPSSFVSRQFLESRRIQALFPRQKS